MKNLQKNRILLFAFVLAAVTAIGGAGYLLFGGGDQVPQSFDGQRALQDVRFQTSLGPRIPGSEAHSEVVSWISSELMSLGWDLNVQTATMLGHPIKNVIAKRSPEEEGDYPWIVVGAHYDSRILADKDSNPEKRSQPVPGANDGASGVAVLLELARVLPRDLQKEVWLVFFDAEDNGNISGWDWILGSTAFVESLNTQPDAVVIVDMVGDVDLEIYMEKNSNPALTVEIWAQAAELGYTDVFIPLPKYSIVDDHIPFLKAGIPAVDIIDINYPYWHTTEDTIDKVSAQSLGIVGQVLTAWLTKIR